MSIMGATQARPALGYPLDRSVINDALVVTKRLGITSKSNERKRRPTRWLDLPPEAMAIIQAQPKNQTGYSRIRRTRFAWHLSGLASACGLKACDSTTCAGIRAVAWKDGHHLLIASAHRDRPECRALHSLYWPASSTSAASKSPMFAPGGSCRMSAHWISRFAGAG